MDKFKCVVFHHMPKTGGSYISKTLKEQLPSVYQRKTSFIYDSIAVMAERIVILFPNGSIYFMCLVPRLTYDII